MSISCEILGQPGRDNALLATVNTGQSQHRLLFDCGEGCLASVPVAHIQDIEAVFFSHFHIDHLAGFDSFFRSNWCRPQAPVRLFGPADARRVLSHRLRGFTWNLVQFPHAGAQPGEVEVTEVDEKRLRSWRFLTREAFEVERPSGERAFDGVAYRAKAFQVDACLVNHGVPCLAYIVRENDRLNVNTQAMAEQGLAPGPWLRDVKDLSLEDSRRVVIDEREYHLGNLRRRLLISSPGESVGYLTDFRIDTPEAESRLAKLLHNCTTLVCENNFRDADAELAHKSYHMTSSEVGRLATRVNPGQLILFHLSDRYGAEDWQEQLEEVRRIFPRVRFPDAWSMND